MLTVRRNSRLTRLCNGNGLSTRLFGSIGVTREPVNRIMIPRLSQDFSAKLPLRMLADRFLNFRHRSMLSGRAAHPVLDMCSSTLHTNKLSSQRIRPNRYTTGADGVNVLAHSAGKQHGNETRSRVGNVHDVAGGVSTSEPKQIDERGDVGHFNPTTLWLRRADQLLLGSLLIALVVLLIAFRWKLSGGGRGEIEIVSQQPREYFYAIDVNQASWVEWAQLDGIGEKLGKRIVKDREDRGPFHSVDEITRVRGLGPKLIEKLRPFLQCVRDQKDERSLKGSVEY